MKKLNYKEYEILVASKVAGGGIAIVGFRFNKKFIFCTSISGITKVGSIKRAKRYIDIRSKEDDGRVSMCPIGRMLS
jgi:hypothetical protein